MTKLARRLVSIPGYSAAAVLAIATAPVSVPAAALVDLVRRSGGVALRSSALLASYRACEEVGLACAATLAQIWKGELLHGELRVRFQRIPRAAIPATREARAAWLRDLWREVDAYVSGEPPSRGGRRRLA